MLVRGRGEGGAVRRVALWGAGLLFTVVLCTSAGILLTGPGAGSVAGWRLPASTSGALADTPFPFMMRECASYPLWERWECASRPVTIVGGAPTSVASCVVVLPQWRVERELQAPQRGYSTELTCSR